VASLFTALKDLLFPPQFLGCKRRLDSSTPPLFCSGCADDLAFIRSPYCLCCGIPFVSGVDHLCGICLTGHHTFDLARALLYYQPPVSDLILSLKFSGNLAGVASLQALITQAKLLDTFVEPEIILPVPLHAHRLRERGFNQALVVARGCLPKWKEKIETGVLLRRRQTTPQSLLSGKERRSNLKNVFSLADPNRIAGMKVLLVDDVYTTGSTINECSRVLRKAGAKRIEVFTLARSLAR
jgi:ComF family protein